MHGVDPRGIEVTCRAMYRHVRQWLRPGASIETRRQYSSYFKVRIQPLRVPNEEISELNHETLEETIKNTVAPLWKVPYAEQLEIKNQWITYAIFKYFEIMKEDLSNSNSKKRQEIPSTPSIKAMCPSPVVHHYRNKNGYLVRRGIDGNPKTVGHVVVRQGNYISVPPSDILSPPSHSKVAQAFQDYIRSSPLPPCHNFSEGGNWTEIQVRSNRLGESVALVKFHPQQLTKTEIEGECGKLKEYFESGPGSTCRLSSLYFQSSPYSNASAKLAPYQLLFGNKYLMETLSGHDFALSPGSFFQCNIKMAEIMYEKIVKAANVSSSTSMLDLGCGIGTLSILAAPHVRSVIGIDMSEEAIHDAKYNAQLNNTYTANFIAGHVENKIKVALKQLQSSSDIVAVLNPGRCGVDVSVIKALRENHQIGTVIYVSCQPNHEWVIRNVLALIKPETGKKKGAPFTFKSAVPLDMFPQTVHCELIMKFVR